MHIYLHIPFCRQKCTYCKFALTPIFTDIQKRRYLSYLQNEIIEWIKTWTNIFPQTIYFWWGTPSILSPKELYSIIELFPKEWREEITLEANPEDITEEYIDTLQGIWINRISLGIQTLNSQSLKTIHRSSVDTIYRALDILKKKNFPNINIDLILWLPHVAYWETHRALTELHKSYPITHTSIYLLEDETYPTDWKEATISIDKMQQEYVTINEYLAELWWNHYEVSNWSRPWYESKHNQSYWNHSNYRWFWLAASSYINWKRWTNSPSFSGYYRWERIDEETLTEEQKDIEHLMFSLRTSGIPLSKLTQEQISILQSHIQDGYIEKKEGVFSITSSWIFLIDHIMSQLI